MSTKPIIITARTIAGLLIRSFRRALRRDALSRFKPLPPVGARQVEYGRIPDA
jgi:hypothetical protein